MNIISSKVKSLLIRTDLGTKNYILSFFRYLFFGSIKHLECNKILIFRTGFIGDTICALPAMLNIKSVFPNARLDLLTNSDKKSFDSVLQLIQPVGFNSIIDYQKFSTNNLIRELKSSKYDLFIELNQYDANFWSQLRNCIFVRMIGIKNAFGWEINSSSLFERFQERNWIFKNERDRLLDMLRKYGLNIDDKISIQWSNVEVRNKVELLLSSIQLNQIGKNVCIVIGSKRNRNKWPVANFIEVVNYFTSKSFNVLILGNDEDKVSANLLVVNNRVRNFCGDLNIIETAEILKNSSLVISNDTGPMHLAYVIGTPVVAIFSSRDFPNKWYPPVSGKNVVFRSNNVLCSICFTRKCFDNICMKQINPNVVISAANNILNLSDN